MTSDREREGNREVGDRNNGDRKNGDHKAGDRKTGERRIGVENSKSRALLVEATQMIMQEEGYVGVSARRVADRAGLKPQLVHYYFRTMDDLFLAVFRRATEQHLERHQRALASSQPLKALWALNSDPSGTALTMEFIALANHRETIREEIVRSAERNRTMQVEVLTEALKKYGVDTTAYPPASMAMLMAGISRAFVMEGTLGIRTGHAELLALVEGILDQLEPAPTDPAAA